VVHVDGEGRERLVTWGELEHRANQAARLFTALGGPAVGTVVVALRNTPEHVFSTLGAWKAGATVLPLRWDLPAWNGTGSWPWPAIGRRRRRGPTAGGHCHPGGPRRQRRARRLAAG